MADALSTWVLERLNGEEHPPSNFPPTHSGLHKNFYSSLIYNPAKLEATKTVFNKWMGKLCYINTVEYHSAIKRNELSYHTKTWMNIECILLSERSQSEKASLYHSIYMTFWKRLNYRDGKQITGFQGSRKGQVGGGLNRWSTGDFLGQWNYSVWYCNGGCIAQCICENP